jgi:hypothetical protein
MLDLDLTHQYHTPTPVTCLVERRIDHESLIQFSPRGTLVPDADASRSPLSPPAAVRPLLLPPAALAPSATSRHARTLLLPPADARASSPATARRACSLLQGAGLAPAISWHARALLHGAGRSGAPLCCSTAPLSVISSWRRCQGPARRVPIGSCKPGQVRVWWRFVPGGGYGGGWRGGEEGRVRVWGCQTRPRTRRVPSVVDSVCTVLVLGLSCNNIYLELCFDLDISMSGVCQVLDKL